MASIAIAMDMNVSPQGQRHRGPDMLQSVVSEESEYNLVTGKQQLREYFEMTPMDMRCNIPMGEECQCLCGKKKGRQTLRCSPSKRTGVLVPICRCRKLRPRGM